jgi:selenocysteine lyase/cysteine desulfurase
MESKTEPHGRAHKNFFDDYYTTPPDKSEVAAQDSSAGDAMRLKLLEHIEHSVIGRDATIETAYGTRRVTYADYTASGRALSFIEQYIASEVLPLYANTHTLTSTTGIQTTLFRQEARDIILRGVRGCKDDVVLFAGSGCTGAVTLLTSVLNIPGRIARGLPVPLVFHGPHEHHSNILPWRESGAVCIEVPEDEEGKLDILALDRLLRTHLPSSIPHAAVAGSERLVVGTFSAASNVTGVLADTVAVTKLLHSFGALAFWDYASAAPYVKIDMNPFNDSAHAKDALFLSPHKFLGGVSTPGVLVVKKRLLANVLPCTPGGGTVFFVNDQHHRYLENLQEREEGGTPDIVGAVRAGLAFQLKEALSDDFIFTRERTLAVRALAELKSIPNLLVAGPTDADSTPRLPILSFLILFNGFDLSPNHPSRSNTSNTQSVRAPMFLHSNFVAALLNDLFGIQARSG